MNLFKHEENAYSKVFAESLDSKDSLQLRNEFIIPTKADLKRKFLARTTQNDESIAESCIYFCGNSLGLQPKRTSDRVQSHLSAWATKGVYGHFTEHEDCLLPARGAFLPFDHELVEHMAPIVGAARSEVAIMETLTANLHILMASFYRPTTEKYKIILEGKAFPSDHYAVESHIRHHDLDPNSAMILLSPPPTSSTLTLTTSDILETISANACSTALILLPGIQYYTGQYFDIPTITAHAHAHGILIGWDLAHATGNVELHLHDWGIDFAAWCNYKYLNSGPGAVAGLFVHSDHGEVEISEGTVQFRPRLSGWWGGEKATRFKMENHFVPIPGAPGFQLGNPSTLALAALASSLEVFRLTSMPALRAKSVSLTGYLEYLLLLPTFPVVISASTTTITDSHHLTPNQKPTPTSARTPLPYTIITPGDPTQRGAQLSIRVREGLLEGVLAELEREGVVVDERRPDVVRVAPAPLYNTFAEVWEFVRIFRRAEEKIRVRTEG